MLWAAAGVLLVILLAAMATTQFGLTAWALALAAGVVAAVGVGVFFAPPRLLEEPADRSGGLGFAAVVGGGVAVAVISLAGIVGLFIDDQRVNTRELDRCIEGTRALTGESYSSAHSVCMTALRNR